MDNLLKIQTQFQQYLEGENEDLIEHIVNTEDALAEHRLAAYYNAYRARLIEAIAFDFPTVSAFLGEDKFNLLVLNYIKAFPSEYKSVRWVAQNLSQFIQQQNKFENQIFLTELIDFEWTQSLVFDETNPDTIFSIEQMALIEPHNWPSLRFNFISSLKPLDLHHNVVQFWNAQDTQQAFPDIFYDVIPIRWIIWRKGLDPHWRSLDVHEAWALESMIHGSTFAEICEGLEEWIDSEHIAITAAGFLKQWIEDELIIGENKK